MIVKPGPAECFCTKSYSFLQSVILKFFANGGGEFKISGSVGTGLVVAGRCRLTKVAVKWNKRVGGKVWVPWTGVCIVPHLVI